MNDTEQKLVCRLVTLAKRQHYTCEEDNWYACPLSGVCMNDNLLKNPRCDCGAAEINSAVDAITSELFT